jgi:hypothetical protein
MSATDNMGQAEFDLQRVFELFDTALISKDERVVNALRNLLMIVALTNPEDADAKGDIGPLRAMERDLNSMNSRIRSLESDMRQIVETLSRSDIASRRYGSDRAYIWPDRSDPNPWSSSSSNVYMNDYLKKLNGGSF